MFLFAMSHGPFYIYTVTRSRAGQIYTMSSTQYPFTAIINISGTKRNNDQKFKAI